MSGNDVPQPPQYPEPGPTPEPAPYPATPGYAPPPPPQGTPQLVPPAPAPQDGQPPQAPYPGQPQAQYPQPPQGQYPGQYPAAPYPGQFPTPPAKTTNGLATAGFVLGLVGLLGSFIPVLNIIGIVLGVIGAILAGVGLAKSKTSGAGKGLAIAGLVLGVLAIIIGIVVNVVFVGAVKDAVDKAGDTTVLVPSDSASAGDDESASAGDDESASDGSSDAPSGSSDLGASRENPAPLGSTIVGTDWTVKVNSVTTAPADSMGQAPAAGKALLVVNLTATYTGNDAQGSSPWARVEYVGTDGTSISTIDGSTLFLPENQFDSMTSVYNGASVTGDEMLEVPADWQGGVLAVSPDLMSDKTFVAVK